MQHNCSTRLLSMLGLEVFHEDQDPMVEEFGQSSIILRMLTISNFDSYIYIYIYSYTCGHCAPISVLPILSSKTTLILILILIWYFQLLRILYSLSLNFTSHFERFTKEIFTLLSWTTNLYGSYNIHHYYYYHYYNFF